MARVFRSTAPSPIVFAVGATIAGISPGTASRDRTVNPCLKNVTGAPRRAETSMAADLILRRQGSSWSSPPGPAGHPTPAYDRKPEDIA